MRNVEQQVRAHVHWAMKLLSIAGIVTFALTTYYLWRDGFPQMVVMNAPLLLLTLWVFFLADTKIDVDQQGIRVTAPYGVYAMNWAEVRSIEIKGQAAYIFGENKLIVYNLLLTGKGKRELQEYIARIIQERSLPVGRPEGVTNSDLNRMLRNTKVRGWKLF